MAELQGDNITDSAGTGSPLFPNGQTGVTDGSDAVAGCIGEYYLHQYTDVTLTSGVYADAGTLVLDPGDYDVDLNGVFRTTNVNSTVTSYAVGLGTMPGNDTTGLLQGVNFVIDGVRFNSATISTETFAVIMPTYRVSISAPLTLYVKVSAGFTTGPAPAVGCNVSWRRMR